MLEAHKTTAQHYPAAAGLVAVGEEYGATRLGRHYEISEARTEVTRLAHGGRKSVASEARSIGITLDLFGSKACMYLELASY